MVGESSTGTPIDDEAYAEYREEEEESDSIVKPAEIVFNIENSLIAREHKHPIFSKSPSISFIPPSLQRINWGIYKPDLVSIGPYHRDRDRLEGKEDWEEHKLYFLNNYKLRSGKADLLESLVCQLLQLEQRARSCYGEVKMSRKDFIKMMLIDGCFVVELLYHLYHHQGEIDVADPVLNRPWLIPKLFRDLLKLENQIPFFVLKLFSEPFLHKQPFQIFEKTDDHGSKHFVELLHSSLNPFTKPTETRGFVQAMAAAFSKNPRPATDQSDQITLSKLYFLNSLIGKCLSKSKGLHGATLNVPHLRSLGVKFKSSEAMNFLDIKFRNNVLEIPSIKINDFMTTVLLNCVAWERAPGYESKSKFVSDYVYFIGCLLKQPSDVAFLRSAGIISRNSQSDRKVCEFFGFVARDVGSISRDSYLSRSLTKLQRYCNSPRATFYLKFISDPLASLPIYAFLILILTLAQAILAILSYLHKERS